MTTSKHDQLKFTNVVIHFHDYICTCNEPLIHSTKLLLKQLSKDLTPKQQEDLQKCLTSTREDVAAIAEDGLDIGEDLERLFAADTEEDSTG